MAKGKIWTWIGRVLLAVAGTPIIAILCLRFVPPPTSAFMLARFFDRLIEQDDRPPTRYHWVGWDEISPHVPLAVIAAEDQKFQNHWGFDLESIEEARERNKKGRKIRGASTITQQVAKNLFLWSGKSYLRKGMEAYLTVLLELFWSKRRILEVYVNIAEFGNGVYGVDAAAEVFFMKDPLRLTSEEAAILAAVLPNPKRLHAGNPSAYVRERAAWIEGQMGRLGGVRYLEGM